MPSFSSKRDRGTVVRRVCAIVNILQTSRRSVSDIATELEICPKTVKRYLTEVSSCWPVAEGRAEGFDDRKGILYWIEKR